MQTNENVNTEYCLLSRVSGIAAYSNIRITFNGRAMPVVACTRSLVHGPAVTINFFAWKLNPLSVSTVTIVPGFIPVTRCRTSSLPPFFTNKSYTSSKNNSFVNCCKSGLIP